METYTLRLFYDGQREIQEEEFQAASPTAAYVLAADKAEQCSASHFNVNLGRIDREEATATQVSRKR
jgi:hypothetical protein